MRPPRRVCLCLTILRNPVSRSNLRGRWALSLHCRNTYHTAFRHDLEYAHGSMAAHSIRLCRDTMTLGRSPKTFPLPSLVGHLFPVSSASLGHRRSHRAVKRRRRAASLRRRVMASPAAASSRGSNAAAAAAAVYLLCGTIVLLASPVRRQCLYCALRARTSPRCPARRCDEASSERRSAVRAQSGSRPDPTAVWQQGVRRWAAPAKGVDPDDRFPVAGTDCFICTLGYIAENRPSDAAQQIVQRLAQSPAVAARTRPPTQSWLPCSSNEQQELRS